MNVSLSPKTVTRPAVAGERRSLINVFDTSIGSDNLGDQIIMDSVWDVLRPMFAGAAFHQVPSHRYATLSQMRAGRRAALSVVGGTNILKAHMLIRGNWRITPLDFLAWRDVVLMGVGWQHYDGEVDPATKLFFASVLSRNYLHSVRDWHTYKKLKPHAPNTIYTACPTMWMLDERRCAQIPVRKARHAVFAVTYYRPAPAQDKRMFELLKANYERLYFWPQQQPDIAYVRELGLDGFTMLEPDIAAYNRLLDDEDVDFVGGRLHGGIRALQRGRRALIIPVDNRGVELGKSTNLPVLSRDDPDAIACWINTPEPVRLILPWDAIARWKSQFTGLAPGIRDS